MQTLRRAAGVLIFPAIAYLGTACERTDMPTAARPRPVMQTYGTPDLIVDDDHAQCPTATFTTIQAAINAAMPGNVILVCAGTYPELLTGTLNINKTLTLLGAQNTVDARTRGGPESVITDMNGTRVNASNVIIDGFTVQNSINPNETGFGIDLSPGISGTQILNNIIQDNIIGIGLANGTGSQALIQHNLIQNNNIPGPATGTGIYTDQFVGGTTVQNVLIKENAFKGNIDAGIDVSNTDPAGGAFNLDVSTNLFDNNGRAVVFFNTHMSTVHDNTITNSTFVGSAAIRLFDNNSDLTVLNNDLTTGAGHAIRLSFGRGEPFMPPTPSKNVVIHENNIGTMGSANFVLDGLLVDPGSHIGTVNATCNWWGSSTGPTDPINNPSGTGEEVVGDADYRPWLLARAPDGVCAGGVPSGKVTGGGRVNVTTGGPGTFGFNAKSNGGVGSGHLNYLNHFTGAHLDCTVAFVTMLTTTTAEFQGPCSPQSSASSFMAHVEDNKDPAPGKGNDRFTITYTDQSGTHVGEGGPGTIISGNIEIH
jgi:parallel beta helix pectate lyase-like protein